jgi:ferritin-like metal-binding protein YciE
MKNRSNKSVDETENNDAEATNGGAGQKSSRAGVKSNHNEGKNGGKEEKSSDSEDNDSEETNQDLHELFVDELSDLLSAEKQLVKALPKMIKAANSDELRSAIEAHLKETEGHVTRLEEAATTLDEKLKSKKCAAMEGILTEASELLQEQKGKSSLDAAIIAAAQKVEHYEIASYGTVIAWANQLGCDEAAEILQATLDEENAADEKLTGIAESIANEEPA